MITPAELEAAGIAPHAAEIVLEWAEIAHAARAALDLIRPAAWTARRIYRAALQDVPAWDRPTSHTAYRADLQTIAEIVRTRGRAAAEEATRAAFEE